MSTTAAASAKSKHNSQKKAQQKGTYTAACIRTSGRPPRRTTQRHVPTLEELLAQTGATPFVTAQGTLVPYRRSRGTYVPLLCDLGTTSVVDAVATASTLVNSLGLYPGKTKKLIKTYNKIAAWCAKHDVVQLCEIVDDTGERLITDLTGVADLQAEVALDGTTRIKTGALNQALAAAARDRRRIHYVRNTLVSLRSATVLTRTRTRSQRVTADSLAYGLPALPSLEDRKGRPLTGEEIMLARFLVEIDNAEGADPGPAITYLVGEAGVRPTESAVLDTEVFDDRRRPTKITAPGVWDFDTRTVKLTDYAVATLPRLLRQLRSGNQPLTFTGADRRHGKAHSSISGVIGRHLYRAGVTDPEVTAKSLNLWRIQHALVRTGDMCKARKYHGGQTANVLNDLKVVANENDVTQGLVHLLRSDNEDLLATVAADSFYDSSFTQKGRGQRTKARR